MAKKKNKTTNKESDSDNLSVSSDQSLSQVYNKKGKEEK